MSDDVTPTLAIEAHRDAAGTADWHFAALRALRGWAQGKEVSREEYDAAAQEVLGLRIGVTNPHPVR